MKAANENTIEFEIANDDNAGRILHENLREQIKAWVRQGGGNETRSRQIWAAIWESLQNAIRYGSDRGDPIRITLTRDPDGLHICVTQPKPWSGAEHALAQLRERASSRDHKVRLGGLTTMYQLASRLNVSNEERTIEMRFGN
jgi:anti-sigma regulatory factor (Ser/Thr protein kinase)